MEIVAEVRRAEGLEVVMTDDGGMVEENDFGFHVSPSLGAN